MNYYLRGSLELEQGGLSSSICPLLSTSISLKIWVAATSWIPCLNSPMSIIPSPEWSILSKTSLSICASQSYPSFSTADANCLMLASASRDPSICTKIFSAVAAPPPDPDCLYWFHQPMKSNLSTLACPENCELALLVASEAPKSESKLVSAR